MAKTYIFTAAYKTSPVNEGKTKEVEAYASQQLSVSFHQLTDMITRKPPGSRQRHVTCSQPSGFIFRLPWNRTFEAEIDF